MNEIVRGLCSLGLLCAFSSLLPAQSFTPLGDLPGVNFSSLAYGVSADGAVVVGVSNTDLNGATFAAFRWEDGVMANLGDHLMRGSIAVGVSADGAVIAGHSESQALNRQAAVRWVNSTLELLDVPGGQFAFARPQAVSGDGTVIIGWHSDSELSAIKWVNGAPELLSTFQGHSGSRAFDVSGNGSVIVGEGQFAFDQPHAVRWSQGGAIVEDIHPAGWLRSSAQAVSADGAVIVGWVENGTFPEPFVRRPFRWENGVLTVLETPGYAIAIDVSGDGSVVLGYDSTIQSPAIWTADDGWRDLIALLRAMNVDLKGYTQFYPPEAISDDGLAIVGSGVNAAGAGEAYRVLLTEMPQEDLVVNDNRDLEDDDPADEICDVDPDETGEQCTLRAAIQEVNRRGGGTITFNIPGGGVPKINVVLLDDTQQINPLPEITAPVTIDGTTQGAGWVEVSGGNRDRPGRVVGLHIGAGAAGSVIRGMVINEFRTAGIWLEGAQSIIENNRIGADPTGLMWRGNGQGYFVGAVGGVHVASSDNAIRNNVISGNIRVFEGKMFGGIEISIDGDRNVVEGNRIGAGADGQVIELPEWGRGDVEEASGTWGVMIHRGVGNKIGGTGGNAMPGGCAPPCNLIVGHKIEILVGHELDDWEGYFESVEPVAVVGHPYAVEEQRAVAIVIARNPEQTLQELWPSLEGMH